VLTREDANSESALLAEWLVEDRADVAKGRPVCVVETSKATVEIEAPGSGTIVQLVAAGVEVELGTCIALVAADAAELEQAEARRPAETAAQVVAATPRNVTRKALELAERHGIDLAQIEKTGFITAEDVEALIGISEPELGEPDHVLAGISTHNVTLPALFGSDDGEGGALDPAFLESLRADTDGFGALTSEEKCAEYRRHGARVGDGVVLGRGVVVVAPRIVLEDGVRIEDGGRVECAEVFAVGSLARFGPGLRLACRRAYVGAGLWGGARVVVGGGGHRDPWATFVVGDNVFLGDEAFVNVCRPVLIGAEALVTMRSMLVTHNIGHSVFEGFENRFAGVVVEDRAQVGLGAVVYAGCRIGREAIVASNSYVVSDIPPGALAIGVPARAVGAASRTVPRQRQAALALQMLDELRELLALRHVAVAPPQAEGVDGLELTGAEGPGRVLFVERLTAAEVPAGAGETVVLTLEVSGPPPEGCAVLELLARRVHGDGGILLDSVREFCRKRGIRFAPGPWRYRGGLV
jgi:carbonic anhydrase/acetyltransferase-like protein (isoleucine patch superfamily)